MPRLPYVVVDVFTDRPFTGNPLAVVLDAGDLATEQLQRLAAEFNLSETAFPMAASEPDADYRLRIFMPGQELPFAGHPSVGGAWVMATEGRLALRGPTTTVRMSCGAGVLPLDVSVDTEGRPTSVSLTAGAPSAGPALDAGATLAAIGLDPADAVAGRAFRVCSTGLPQAFLCVEEEAVGRMAADPAAIASVAASLGFQTLSVFSWAPAGGAGAGGGGAGGGGAGGGGAGGPGAGTAHARVLAAGLRWGEDPATGSAGSALGAWLAAEGLVAGDGPSRYVVHQGAEMGRGAVLSCQVVAGGGVATGCRVAGQAVEIARGSIEVPLRAGRRRAWRRPA